MTNNSIYDTPVMLEEYILRERRITAGSAAASEALTTLNAQWRGIVDEMTYGQVNDLIGIKRAGNGRLVTTFNADHNYTDGVLIAVPYRFPTVELAQRYVNEYIDWLDVDGQMDRNGTLVKLTLRPKEGTSKLRSRAFGFVVKEAKAQLGNALSELTTDATANPMLVLEKKEFYTGRDYVSGVQVHQIYWMLAVAKELRDNLTQMMRDSIRANRTNDQAPIKRHDTSESFKVFMRQRRHIADNLPKESIEGLPMLPMTATTERTWGIEVESGGARGIGSPGNGWQRKYDGSLESAYSGWVPEPRDAADCPYHDHRMDTYDEQEGLWVENPDFESPDYCDWVSGSDYDDDDGSSDCAEFVSPILNEAGNADLQDLLAKLITQPQNDTAGVHVHVGAGDLTPKQLGALVFAYQMVEPIITPAYRRNRRNYCKERTPEDVIETIKKSKDANARKTSGDHGSGPVMSSGDRYVSVNLNALQAHGTVEFRAMGPVYEYEHLIKWALFCREMVSIAKANVPPKVWTSIKNWKDLSKVLHTYGPELKRFSLDQMEEQFAPEVENLVVTR